MRAHKALETLEQVRVRPDAPDGAEIHREVQAAKLLLGQAVSFDFGKVSTELAHREFGVDLLSRGLLRLPYDVVFFSSAEGYFIAYQVPDISKHTNPLKAIERAHSGLRDYGHAPRVTPAEELADLQKERDRGVLRVVSLAPEERDCFMPELRAVATGDHPNNISVAWWHLLYPDIPEKQATSHAASAVGIVAGLVALLMNKDVETTHHAAPAQLNKARERKGKPAIRDTYEVRIRRTAPLSGGQGNGGTHASPRMHWRRGHYRKLGERLIPVAPCLVNASDRADTLLSPKDYVMPAPMGWKLQKEPKGSARRVH